MYNMYANDSLKVRVLKYIICFVFQAVVDVVVNLQFSLIEALWQGFWRNQSLDQR